VWCGDGDAPAPCAAERMNALRYQDAAMLDGGLAAGKAAGYCVDSGVHVPSKVFAKVGEHEARARPRDCAGIEALIDTGNRPPLLRRQSWERVARSMGPSGSPTMWIG
jgi:hypothetical protein